MHQPSIDFPTVTVQTKQDFAESQRAQVNTLLYLIYALLGLAIVIAILGLVIPAGFSRDLESGGTAHLQLLFDGTNSNVATVAQGYAEGRAGLARDFGVGVG